MGRDIWFSDRDGYPDYSFRDDARWVDPRRTRERSSHPYSYDEFFVWGDRESIKDREGLYSDRIWQWDRAKAERCWAEHCRGCRWDTAGKAKVKAFLSDYLGKSVNPTAVAEGCNASTGYPYWIVWFEARPDADTSDLSPDPGGSING